MLSAILLASVMYMLLMIAILRFGFRDDWKEVTFYTVCGTLFLISVLGLIVQSPRTTTPRTTTPLGPVWRAHETVIRGETTFYEVEVVGHQKIQNILLCSAPCVSARQSASYVGH